MKTRVVPSEELDPKKGLRAEDYMDILKDDEAFEALQEIISQCFRTARSKGWWEKYAGALSAEFTEEIISSKLMLMVSELSETLEEIRAGVKPTETYYSHKTSAGVNVVLRGSALESVKESLEWRDGVLGWEYDEGNFVHLKPEGVPTELADVVIRVFDLAGWLGIDLASAIREKMRFNKTRPYRHGGKAI